MKVLFLFLTMMATAAPAHAFRVGLGIEGGVLDGEPASGVLLDLNAGPRSRIHWQPFVGAAPGMTEVGMNVLLHNAECHETSFFGGVGVGLAFLEAAPVPCCEPEPLPRHEPTPTDPPFFNLLAGVRWVPGTMAEIQLKGRLRFDHEGDMTGGAYVVLIGHEPRNVAGAKKAHRHGGRKR